MLNHSDKLVDINNNAVRDAQHSVHFRLLSLADVYANPHQPRKIFEKQALEELAQSIEENGILQPILVRQIGEKYQIISGERRFRAAKIAGLNYIPAIVCQMNEEQTLLAALIENIQRQDLNPIEEAKTLKKILLNYGLSHEQLAKKVGCSRSALTNRLRLLQLPHDVQLMVIESKISPGHAKMLAGMKNPLEIRNWAHKIVNEQLSVSETEKKIAQYKERLFENVNKKNKNKIKPLDFHVKAVEERLQELLGAKVRIRLGKRKGRIELEFYDRNDLERVVESMVSLYL